MIMRVFQVTVHEGKEAAFRDFFLHTALPLMRRQEGLVSISAGAPLPETPQAFCMVMVWRDIEALEAFVGPTWREAHVHPDEVELVAARRLEHYELVGG
jgi:quinol monooxygenase YgiN